MSDIVYNEGIAQLFKGDTDLDTADLRVLLLKSTATPNKDDDFVADAVTGSNEISVAGYGRQTLAGETVTKDDTNDQVYLDANDPTYTALVAGQTIGWQVLFRHTGSDGTAPLLCAYDLVDTPTNGSDVVVVFNSPGNGGCLRGISA